MAARITTVGVISDTHGLLRDSAVAELSASQLIIHAGDVGKPEILERLRQIAPVIAVRGIIDKGDSLPKTAIAQAGPALIYVLHDIHELELDPVAAGFHIVISGHSHKPSRIDRAGVTYLNPGSAGPRRFTLPITLARMNLAQFPWTIDFVELR